MAKRKKLGITVESVLQELDSLRPTRDPRSRVFTAEQDAALMHARSGDSPIPWATLAEWWGKKWGRVNIGTLRKHWRELRASS